MQQNAFAGHSKQPTEKELASVLGPALDHWVSLIADLKRDLKTDIAEWHSSSIKLGWSLRLQIKKRNVVYLGPRQGWFMAAFALGDKAVAKTRTAPLPQKIHKHIGDARKYAEGTAVRIEVKTREDAEAVRTLARIKAEN